MTTEERLENLERELARAKRRNRWLLAAVLLGAGVLILATAWVGTPEKVLAENAAKAPTIIRANRFILEDENGKVRASLGVNKDGPVLVLSDENGNGRVGLAVQKDGPWLSLSDENGKFRAGLSADKGGSKLSLGDENGNPRVWLGADKDGPALSLGDENGKPRASLHVFKDRPVLILRDEKGEVIWAAGGADGVAATPRQVTPSVEAAPPVKAAPQWRPCPACNGSGTSGSICHICDGTGKKSGGFKCSSCNGRGFSPCSSCNGKGMVR